MIHLFAKSSSFSSTDIKIVTTKVSSTATTEQKNTEPTAPLSSKTETTDADTQKTDTTAEETLITETMYAETLKTETTAEQTITTETMPGVTLKTETIAGENLGTETLADATIKAKTITGKKDKFKYEFLEKIKLPIISEVKHIYMFLMFLEYLVTRPKATKGGAIKTMIVNIALFVYAGCFTWICNWF